MRWFGVVVMALVLVGLCGCTAYHIDRLKDVSLERLRVTEAQALGKYPHVSNPAATEALIAACEDEYAAVRFFAIASLANHFPLDAAMKERLFHTLIDHLDDGERGSYPRRFGPFMPYGFETLAPPVRTAAYHVLTMVGGGDFGLDQEAWRRHLFEKCVSEEEGEKPLQEGELEPMSRQRSD
jgi:hypothetical protein